MGIAPYKHFTYDGESSRDYDVYITGTGVFNAPERDVEMFTIPGRNGSYALDHGKFNNISVTYNAGIVDYSESNFANKVSAVRNWLCSKVGYKRLSDDYNPNEYRMAVYKSGVTVEHIDLKTGEFEITFECKPQRWLTSGEEAVTIGEWGETETVSGEVVEVEATDTDAVKSLVADIDPIQDLNGYDAPWVGGAGKNKFPYVVGGTSGNATAVVSSDGSVTLNGTGYARFFTDYFTVPAGTYILNGNTDYPNTVIYLDGVAGSSDINTGTTITLSEETTTRGVVQIYTDKTVSNLTLKPMLRKSAESSTYEPYSNICPISGHTEVEVVVSPTTDAEDGTTYTTALGRTVYGGTLDLVSGELTVDKAIVDLGTLLWNYGKPFGGANEFFWTSGLSGVAVFPTVVTQTDAICSCFYAKSANEMNSHYSTTDGAFSLFNNWVIVHDNAYTDAATFKTAMTGQTICYELATPQTYQLTPQQIELLLGTNNIWADSGDVTIEYGQNPMVLVNPTPFEAEPLLSVDGYGTISFNGYEVEIENVPIGMVELSKETMSPNLSYSVTISGSQALSVGDTITINGISNTYYYTKKNDVTLSNVSFAQEVNCTGYATNGYQTIQLVVGEMNFSYGTSSTETASIRIAVVYTKEGTEHSVVGDSTFTVAYNGLDEFTITSPYPHGVLYAYTQTYSRKNVCPPIIGDSTHSVIPVYIDCDIGECWTVQGGEIVSLNGVISLGSDLPKLSSGTNTFTYDNTVTELKVTPRWWKV